LSSCLVWVHSSHHFCFYITLRVLLLGLAFACFPKVHISEVAVWCLADYLSGWKYRFMWRVPVLLLIYRYLVLFLYFLLFPVSSAYLPLNYCSIDKPPSVLLLTDFCCAFLIFFFLCFRYLHYFSFPVSFHSVFEHLHLSVIADFGVLVVSWIVYCRLSSVSWVEISMNHWTLRFLVQCFLISIRSSCYRWPMKLHRLV
jgi:hypothetical protein